jgi:cytidine deaminase
MLPENEAYQLFEEAKKVSSNSYSPYSNFSVGAAVLTKSGLVFTGVNVENAAYEVAHAERSAISAMVSTGNRDIKAIAVYAAAESVPPCGSCRQLIMEFGNDIIVIFKYDGILVQKTISELLPYKFSL